jgi:hypothetical protein
MKLQKSYVVGRLSEGWVIVEERMREGELSSP